MKEFRFVRACAVLMPLFFLTQMASAQAPEWIWNSTGVAEGKTTLYFRKTFTLTKDAPAAKLSADADDNADFYINGKKVATVTDWKNPVYVDVTKNLHKGENIITIRGENALARGGVLAGVELTEPNNSDTSDGKHGKHSHRTVMAVATSASWKYSTKEEANWDKVDFNDTSWTPAVSAGKLGVEPWGAVFETRQATPVSAIETARGFTVELLHSADQTEGSWISMTEDNKGRLIVSPQSDGPLLRITLSHGKVAHIERLDVPVTSAMGLLYDHHTLYINGHGPKGTGVYKARAHGDKFEAPILLRNMAGEGEHGSHGLVMGPDKKIYVVSGNFTKVPEDVSSSSPCQHFADDQLLPRAPDGRGFGNGLLPPGGFVLRMDQDGSHPELFAAGTRNTYDIAFSPDGELFGFDSDMEWDWGTAWYRPIRVNHWVAGGDYGFREGTGKFPEYYEDTLPASLNIGIGSPTGVMFGTDSNFPRKYRSAFFMLDWSYGRIFAVHLTPHGATYDATSETIVTGKPLNLTALAFGHDGAMYFITGGRGTESGLYRLTYTGPKIAEPYKTTAEVDAGREAEKALKVRHYLESFYGQEDTSVIDSIWPWLNSEDRWIRYAARTALEFRPAVAWKDRAVAETNVYGGLTALLALARTGPSETQRDLLLALRKFPIDTLSDEQKLLKLRVIELSFIRQGRPDPDLAQMAIEKLDAHYPSASAAMNRELCQLLLYLQAPDAVAKTLSLLDKTPTQEEQTGYVLHLRTITNDWTMDLRKHYLGWFRQNHEKLGHPPELLQYFKDARRDYSDGASFSVFMTNFLADNIATLNESESNELASFLPAHTNYIAPGKTRKFVKNWQMQDIQPDLDRLNSGRSFTKGRAAFIDSQCILCHRFGKTGGSVGPELTAVSSRLTARDILESILLPSKVVSELFQNTIFSLKDGDDVIGRIAEETDQKVTVITDPLKMTKVEVLKSNIVGRRLSKVSPMPEGVANVLHKDEILDLIAYLQSGGKRTYAAFKQ